MSQNGQSGLFDVGGGVIIAGMILHTDMSLHLAKRHFIRKITDGGFVLNHDTFRKDFVLFYTKNLVSFFFFFEFAELLFHCLVDMGKIKSL